MPFFGRNKYGYVDSDKGVTVSNYSKMEVDMPSILRRSANYIKAQENIESINFKSPFYRGIHIEEKYLPKPGDILNSGGPFAVSQAKVVAEDFSTNRIDEVAIVYEIRGLERFKDSVSMIRKEDIFLVDKLYCSA
jgi:hypothetical protein